MLITGLIIDLSNHIQLNKNVNMNNFVYSSSDFVQSKMENFSFKNGLVVSVRNVYGDNTSFFLKLKKWIEIWTNAPTDNRIFFFLKMNQYELLDFELYVNTGP